MKKNSFILGKKTPCLEAWKEQLWVLYFDACIQTDEFDMASSGDEPLVNPCLIPWETPLSSSPIHLAQKSKIWLYLMPYTFPYMFYIGCLSFFGKQNTHNSSLYVSSGYVPGIHLNDNSQ